MEGWTVCTGSKPHNSDAAIQLYLKHGMVEAMRVFDRSLLSGELGVGLGDNLQAMKSQFGEPAFIIHEPTPSASPSGQNYVYPISQVCFQLSRSGKDAPRVVSVQYSTSARRTKVDYLSTDASGWRIFQHTGNDHFNRFGFVFLAHPFTKQIGA